MNSERALKIGCHINISKGFKTSAEHCHSLGGNVMQIFLSNPRGYKTSNYKSQDLEFLKKSAEEFNVEMFVHGKYLLNFSREIGSKIHTSAIAILIHELNLSVKFGAKGVVIHMGKSKELDTITAMTNFVKGVRSSLQNSDPKSIVILETSTGKGSEICSKLSDFIALYKMFTDQERDTRIKICIDTCHIFAAGYDISSRFIVKVLDNYLEKFIGWKNIILIHLNDSNGEICSCKDSHCEIGYGHIGNKGLKKFVQICHKRNVPMVLETPQKQLSKVGQIEKVKEWAKEIEN